MHATTVELLTGKARLEPEIAVAFAEAIDMAIGSAQLVTVPILDARLAVVDARLAELETRLKAEFDAKLEKCKAELVQWVFLVMLGNVALSAGVTATLNALQHGH